jgi:hypothetical protein
MEQGSDEVMTLAPLTVTGGEGTPAAATPVVAEASPVASAPRGDVTLIMTDNPSFLISSGTVPTGPQLWEVTNTGELQSHHVVMVRIPDGLTEDDIVSGFGSLLSGTPSASPPVSTQFTYVGYAALQSGGTTTWQEFDLDPGTYAVLCFIVDPETGVPHLMDGMVKTFTVE